MTATGIVFIRVPLEYDSIAQPLAWRPEERRILMTRVVLVVSIAVVAAGCGGNGCGRQRLITCGQQTMTGQAPAITYANARACVQDRANQQRIARQDGIGKCATFCMSLGANWHAAAGSEPATDDQ